MYLLLSMQIIEFSIILFIGERVDISKFSSPIIFLAFKKLNISFTFILSPQIFYFFKDAFTSAITDSVISKVLSAYNIEFSVLSKIKV